MLVTRRRSLYLLAGAAILIAGCGGWKSRPSSWSNATGAEQFERLWWTEVKAKHWKELGFRMAVTYVWISDDGIRDREQTLAYLQQLEVEEFTLGDVDVRPNGNDLIITYSLTMRARLAGQPINIERVPMMTVWQRQKSGWVAIAHSSLSGSKT
jgi:hypothetical protein